MLSIFFKRIVTYLLFLVLSFLSISQAEIPFNHAQGVYEGTKASYKEISPFWGFVALHGKLLERIRFFGPYEQKKIVIKHPRHPSRTFTQDEPMDGNDYISRLILMLFPSPDGYQFVPNTRRKDAVGNLSRFPEKINDIIKALVEFKKQPSRIKEAIKTITELLPIPDDAPSYMQEKNESLAKVLVMAQAYERIRANPLKSDKQLYPENIVIISLLSYFVAISETKEDLKKLPFLMSEDFDDQNTFSRDQYEAMKSKGSEALEALLNDQHDLEMIFLMAKGFDYFEKPFLDPVNYATQRDFQVDRDPTFDDYPNCGEISILNVLTIAFTALNQGKVSPAALASLTKKIIPIDDIQSPDSLFQKMISFFKSDASSRFVWSPLISSLNECSVRDDLSKVQYGLAREGSQENISMIVADRHPEIKGVINLLNVLSRLIPDETLAAPWLLQREKRLDQISQKVTRLMELLSRDDITFTWEVEGTKDQQITDEFSHLIIKGNGIPIYVWEFGSGHYGVRPLAYPSEDWRNNYSFLASFHNDWMASLFQLNTPPSWFDQQRQPITISQIYTPDLFTPYIVEHQIKRILLSQKRTFFPLFKRWIEKSSFLSSPYFLGRIGALIYPNTTLPFIDRLFEQTLLPAMTEDGKYEAAISALNNKDLKTALYFLRSLNIEKLKEWGTIYSIYIPEDQEATILSLLIEAGYDVNQTFMNKNPLDQAIEAKNNPVVALLLQNGAHFTPQHVHLSAKSGDLTLLSLFLQYGASHTIQNEDGHTLLHTAVSYNQPSYASFLLTEGAMDVNIRDETGKTPLFYGNDQKTLDLLLSHKADVTVVDSQGNTPLHDLACVENIDLKPLLDLGADINALNDNGLPPLLNALKKSDSFLNVKTIEKIIKAGANLFVKDKTGSTALHYAAAGNDLEIVEFLLAEADRQDFFLNNENWFLPDGKSPSDLTNEDFSQELFNFIEKSREKWAGDKGLTYQVKTRSQYSNSSYSDFSDDYYCDDYSCDDYY